MIVGLLVKFCIISLSYIISNVLADVQPLFETLKTVLQIFNKTPRKRNNVFKYQLNGNITLLHNNILALFFLFRGVWGVYYYLRKGPAVYIFFGITHPAIGVKEYLTKLNGQGRHCLAYQLNNQYNTPVGSTCKFKQVPACKKCGTQFEPLV